MAPAAATRGYGGLDALLAGQDDEHVDTERRLSAKIAGPVGDQAEAGGGGLPEGSGGASAATRLLGVVDYHPVDVTMILDL